MPPGRCWGRKESTKLQKQNKRLSVGRQDADERKRERETFLARDCASLCLFIVCEKKICALSPRGKVTLERKGVAEKVA